MAWLNVYFQFYLFHIFKIFLLFNTTLYPSQLIIILQIWQAVIVFTFGLMVVTTQRSHEMERLSLQVSLPPISRYPPRTTFTWLIAANMDTLSSTSLISFLCPWIILHSVDHFSAIMWRWDDKRYTMWL